MKSVEDSDSVKVIVSVWPVLSVPLPERAIVTVGAVASIVTGAAAVEVCVSVIPSIVSVDVARTLYNPGDSSAVVHDQSPLAEVAVQVDPVFVHVPVVGSVSDMELAVAVDN
jgi:hypothetical protein